MTRIRRPSATAIAVPLTALLLTLSVAAPLLERAELSRAPVVESEHEPGTCPTAHDHTVCRQLSSNLAAPSAHGAPLRELVGTHAGRIAGAEDARDLRARRTTSARAPPRT